MVRCQAAVVSVSTQYCRATVILTWLWACNRLSAHLITPIDCTFNYHKILSTKTMSTGDDVITDSKVLRNVQLWLQM